MLPRFPLSQRARPFLITVVVLAIIGMIWYGLSAKASAQPSDDTHPKLLTDYTSQEDTVASVRYKAWLWSVCTCYDTTNTIEDTEQAVAAFDTCTSKYTYALAQKVGYEPDADQAMLDIQGCR